MCSLESLFILNLNRYEYRTQCQSNLPWATRGFMPQQSSLPTDVIAKIFRNSKDRCTAKTGSRKKIVWSNILFFMSHTLISPLDPELTAYAPPDATWILCKRWLSFGNSGCDSEDDGSQIASSPSCDPTSINVLSSILNGHTTEIGQSNRFCEVSSWPLPRSQR